MPGAQGVGLRFLRPSPPSGRLWPDPDANLRADLHTIHAGSRRAYGRPRLVKALRARAQAVGHKRVGRLMRVEGLRGEIKGRFGPTPSTVDTRDR